MNIGGIYFKTFPRLHQYLALLELMKITSGEGQALLMSKGLGKTKTIIDWIVNFKPKRVLIIAPRIAMKVWKEQFEEHSYLTPTRAHGNFNLNLLDSPIVYTTYESVRSRGINFWRVRNWDAVILDESTKIKNFTTQATQVILHGFSAHTPYKIIMTGRPITNSHLDIFSQYWFLDDGKSFGKSLANFKYQYFFQSFGYKYMLSPTNRAQFYRTIAKRAIIYTSKFMLKYEGIAFPKMITRTRILSLSKVQKEYMDTLIDEFQIKLDSGTVYQTDWRLSVDIKLRQLCAGFLYLSKGEAPLRIPHPKLKAIRETIDELEAHEKVVIFTTFNEETNILEENIKRWYPKRLLTVLRSSSSIDDLEIAITEHEYSKSGILLTNAALARFSLSLSTTRYAIYASRSYSVETYDQSRGRIARLSTKFPNVYYLNLVYRTSIDVLIDDALKNNLTHGEYLNNVVEFISNRRG